MKLGLRGKVALVTGATGALGAACASELAGEGCRVFLTARTEAALAELDGLEGRAATLAQDWRADAQAHLVAEQALGRLQVRAIALLGS